MRCEEYLKAESGIATDRRELSEAKCRLAIREQAYVY